MDTLWIVLAGLVVAVLLTLATVGILTGRLKRFKAGPTGLEIEGPDLPHRSPAVAAAMSSAPSGPPDRDRTEARWREHVDASYDKYFGKKEQRIDDLAQDVSRGATGSVTSVRGEGGVGKTAAAYEAVSMSAENYDMIAWASFRQYRNPTELERGQGSGRSLHEVLRDLSNQLGLNINPSDALVARQFVDAIRRLSNMQRILLVIDNLELLTDVRDILNWFMRNKLPWHCQVLVTTRASAAGMSGVDEWFVGGLPLEPSCDLMRHVGRGSSELSAAENSTLAPIHAVLDGNPYLMKLVASRLCYQASPLDHLLYDIRRLDAADGSSFDVRRIRAYMFDQSLIQLADRVGMRSAQSLLYAFCGEPPSSHVEHARLQALSELPDKEFQRALDAAYELSLVTKHGLNQSFSIHGLLHSYTRSGGGFDEG